MNEMDISIRVGQVRIDFIHGIATITQNLYFCRRNENSKKNFKIIFKGTEAFFSISLSSYDSIVRIFATYS